jgi:hypothetical protein
LSLVGPSVIEEVLDVGNGGDPTIQVETEPAEELRIIGDGGGLDDFPTLLLPVCAEVLIDPARHGGSGERCLSTYQSGRPNQKQDGAGTQSTSATVHGNDS